MPPTKTVNAQTPCPCGSKKPLTRCCLPYIERKTGAPTAEILMRSRYTAHVLLAIEYLWDTWSPEQRVASTKDKILAWARACEWQHLEILSTQAGLETDTQGWVTFIATYRQQGKICQHHEISLFKKFENTWRYVSHSG